MSDPRKTEPASSSASPQVPSHITDPEEAAGIMRGLADVKAGRVKPLDQIDAELASSSASAIRPLDIEPIKARASAYFEGGWHYYPPDQNGWADYVPAARRFYAEAARDIPALLAEVERLRSSVAAKEPEIKFLVCKLCGCRIDTGLCGYGCDFDGDQASERKTEQLEIHVYRRVGIEPSPVVAESSIRESQPGWDGHRAGLGAAVGDSVDSGSDTVRPQQGRSTCASDETDHADDLRRLPMKREAGFESRPTLTNKEQQ